MSWLIIALLAVDLGTIKTEPNLEHRSELALENADTAFTAARDAYTAGNLDKAVTGFTEVGDSVDLAYEALEATGKSARHNPKFFKKAELSTRQLLRRLDAMVQSMSYSDRALLETVRERVADVHDTLLKEIMSKK